MRRNSRNILARRPNPLREMMADQRRSAEVQRTRARAEQLQDELPAIIENQVGEHMQKLEDKLLQDFKDIGQRAVEQTTAVLTDQLSGRIESLEKISALQSKTLVNMRDSSRVAEEKVSSVVDSIERALSTAVPGFQLEPPAHPRTSAYEPAVLPQLKAGGALMKADTREIDEAPGKYGHCPVCTSPNLRRAYRKGLLDELLRLLFIAPYRCRACRHKFYRF